MLIKNSQLDADPLLLNFHNGTLDLRTLSLRPHDPGDLLTMMAGCEFSTHEPSPQEHAPTGRNSSTTCSAAAKKMKRYVLKLCTTSCRAPWSSR